MQLLWISLGGALGTAARYLIFSWTLRRFGPGFPYATLLVNVAGSFLIALAMHPGPPVDLLRPTLRLALTTGVLGGFTTYSAFSYESLRLFQQGAWALGGLYVLATLAGGLLAAFLGFAAGARWFGA